MSTSVKTPSKKISNSRHLGFFPPTCAPPSLTCDVIDYHGDSGVADVAGDETPETLLPGRVPQLQAHLHEPTNVPEIQQEDKKEERGGEEEAVREYGSERTDEGRREVEAGSRGVRGRLVSEVPTCDVVHYNSGGRVADVAGDQATESLLACRVPQLQPDLCVMDGTNHVEGEKETKEKKEKKEPVKQNT